MYTNLIQKLNSTTEFRYKILLQNNVTIKGKNHICNSIQKMQIYKIMNWQGKKSNLPSKAKD